MWELDHKEAWALKNWCFRTGVLENTFESPLDSTEIKPVNPKGNQPWIFIGRTDAEAPILWPPDAKSCLIGKIRGDRGWNGLIASQTHWTWVWANWETMTDRKAWCAAVHWVTKGQTWLSDWTTTIDSELFGTVHESSKQCRLHLLQSTENSTQYSLII